ncbi:hypothetical protein HUN08_00060 [Gordonia sp. X0973]|nr:hypothetical protein [Gordonia sp. X0973]QKT05774.1 hypothetical protein HUN08_00060 [Gordonia sp. X0973]
MGLKSLVTAALAALALAVAAAAVRRRLGSGSVPPIADAPPRVSDFSH